jgi:catechol 2,3-dioxygenase-like lactoylglutathione lyase family enzyme
MADLAGPPFHLAHLNIITRDWRRSLDFYQRVFGARYLGHIGPHKVITEIDGFEFFIEEAAEVALNPSFHFGFRTTPEGVFAFERRLRDLAIPLVEGNNARPEAMVGPDDVRVALYFRDPDGWLIEVYSPEKLMFDEAVLGKDPRWTADTALPGGLGHDDRVDAAEGER